jgi:hypothetical protein
MVKRDETKMIMVTVGFWTDSLPPDTDALPFGTVQVRANGKHGIKSGPSTPFNSKETLADTVFAAMEQAGVRFASGPVSEKRRANSPSR